MPVVRQDGDGEDDEGEDGDEDAGEDDESGFIAAAIGSAPTRG